MPAMAAIRPKTAMPIPPVKMWCTVKFARRHCADKWFRYIKKSMQPTSHACSAPTTTYKLPTTLSTSLVGHISTREISMVDWAPSCAIHMPIPLVWMCALRTGRTLLLSVYCTVSRPKRSAKLKTLLTHHFSQDTFTPMFCQIVSLTWWLLLLKTKVDQNYGMTAMLRIHILYNLSVLLLEGVLVRNWMRVKTTFLQKFHLLRSLHLTMFRLHEKFSATSSL